MGQLDVYTDASVMGQSYRLVSTGTSVRAVKSRVGPAMGAWIGWHDCNPATRPTIVGQAYLGRRLGTQGAEFLALIHGLHAALAYAKTTAESLDRLVLSVDNHPVERIMNQAWTGCLLRITRLPARPWTGSVPAACLLPCVRSVRRTRTIRRLTG